MNMSQEDFMRKLRETFYIEGHEHLNRINSGLLEIEKKGLVGEEELIDTIFREAHNLKGGARAVNHDSLQNICQSLESVLSALRAKTIELTPDSFDVLYDTLGIIRQFLEVDSGDEDSLPENNSSIMIELLESIAKGDGDIKAIRSSPKRAEHVVKKADSQKQLEAESKTEKISATNHHLEESSPKNPAPKKTTAPKVADSTIRVGTKKLNGLLRQIEETLVIKLASKQRVEELQDISKELDNWKKQRQRLQKDLQVLRQWLHASYKRNEVTAPHATIESILQQICFEEDYIKKLSDDILKISNKTGQDSRISATIIDSLLGDTKTILLQPFSTILEAFPMMVRDISRSLNKKIKLDIEGEHIEIDRRILEELKDPLMHLIRNSIDHGIESQEKRKLLKKSSEGRIEIKVTEISGNSVNITISDDGQGIDVQKLKESAVKSKVLSAEDAKKLNDKEALMLMYQSGVSTSEIITDLSGRGLGVGIVSEKVEKLGGKIVVDTVIDKGTTFQITIPITLTTFRGVYITACDQEYIIPTNYLQRVLWLKTRSITTIEGKKVILYEGKNIPYIHLKDILGLERTETKKEIKQDVHVLILKASEIIIALGVDKVLKEEEVFVKGLGDVLTKIKNISAATVADWGKVIPILDPFDIARAGAYGSKQTSFVRKKETTKPEAKQKILIVEDSITARMLLKNILESAGYDVITTVDGVEAYSILHQEKIDLMLSDIEMPRMNGFELTEKVRQDEKIKDTPIVLCSSLSTREDKEKGIAAGADAYIIKSNFEQSNLLDIIEKLI